MVLTLVVNALHDPFEVLLIEAHDSVAALPMQFFLVKLVVDVV